MLIVLRPAACGDREDIANIWHASASLSGVGPDPMPSREVLRGRVDVEFEAGWQVTLAERYGETIGFVAIKQADAVLAELFVRPDSVGGGVGRRLLDHAKAMMPDRFSLYTRSANLRACHFYEQNGLREVKRDVHPRSGDPITYYVWK